MFNPLQKIVRDAYLYAEGDREIRIRLHLCPPRSNFLLYRSAFQRWQPPYNQENIPEAKQERILQHVCQRLTESNISFEVLEE